MKKTILGFALLTLIGGGFVFYGCSRGNIFSFAHKEGKASSKEALLSDALVALRERDYSTATRYYQELVDRYPNSADALYGYAASVLGEAGLDLPSLLTRVIESEDTLAAPRLTNVIARAAALAPTKSLIPEDLDLNRLRTATAEAVNALRKIVEGLTDGAIPADDVDVNLNLAITLVINAACNLIDSNNNGDITSDSGDVIEITEDYEVIFHENVIPHGDAVYCAKIDSAITAVLDALDYLQVALVKSGVASDSTIAELRQDVNELLGSAQTEDSLRWLKNELGCP